MKISVLGTGTVGRVISGSLQDLGHDVVMGTRDPEATRNNDEKDAWGNPSFKEWHAEHGTIRLATFSDAAESGDMIIIALSGKVTIEVLSSLPDGSTDGKLVWDIANPLDFSNGMPPSLFISNSDSLGEQVQAALPKAKVVKTLNTVTAQLMVNPGALGSEHSMFVAGNDEHAKVQTIKHLKEWFGWKDIIDLGDITQARGTEMFLPLWVRTYASLQTPMFGMKIVR